MEAAQMSLLVEEYGDALYRYCRSITYTGEDTEDLYQQTFLKAFELGSKISFQKNPKSYLFSIATNIRKNQKSKYARRNRIAPELSADVEWGRAEVLSNDEDVLETLIKEEEIMRLKACVDKLPEKQRQVVLLHYAGELSIADISRALKIPKGTVKSRLFQGREKIKKEMEDD